eukprot:scaffold187804_cov26-Tisochrysis_lutea.AAC.1
MSPSYFLPFSDGGGGRSVRLGAPTRRGERSNRSREKMTLREGREEDGGAAMKRRRAPVAGGQELVRGRPTLT